MVKLYKTSVHYSFCSRQFFFAYRLVHFLNTLNFVTQYYYLYWLTLYLQVALNSTNFMGRENSLGGEEIGRGKYEGY